MSKWDCIVIPDIQNEFCPMRFVIFFEDIISVHISPDRRSINDRNGIRYLSNKLDNILDYDLISRKTDGKMPRWYGGK